MPIGDDGGDRVVIMRLCSCMTGMAYRSEVVPFPASYEVSSRLVRLGLGAIIYAIISRSERRMQCWMLSWYSAPLYPRTPHHRILRSNTRSNALMEAVAGLVCPVHGVRPKNGVGHWKQAIPASLGYLISLQWIQKTPVGSFLTPLKWHRMWWVWRKSASSSTRIKQFSMPHRLSQWVSSKYKSNLHNTPYLVGLQACISSVSHAFSGPFAEVERYRNISRKYFHEKSEVKIYAYSAYGRSTVALDEAEYQNLRAKNSAVILLEATYFLGSWYGWNLGLKSSLCNAILFTFTRYTVNPTSIALNTTISIPWINVYSEIA